jgi:hypothetical protein
MNALRWDDDPRELFERWAWAAEADRCLSVLTGARRWDPADYTDERLRLVAAVGESARESGAAPTPWRIATVLGRMGLPDGGALRWISRLQFGCEKLETGA